MRPSGEKASPRRSPARRRGKRLRPGPSRRSPRECTSPSCWPPASRRPSGEKASETSSRGVAPPRRVGSEARRSPLGQVANLDAGRGRRDRELRAVGAEGQPDTRCPRCSGRPDQLRPVEVPDPYGAGGRGSAPGACRSEHAARRRTRARGRRGSARPAPRGAEERADSLPGPSVPEPEAAVSPCHRQSAPVGRVLDRGRWPCRRKASKPPVLRSVSPSIRSTRPSILATARVRPSGLVAKLAARAGTGRCRCWCGKAVGAAGRRPRPRSKSGVRAGRVEGAPVGTEGLALHTWARRPRRSRSARPRLQVPQAHVPVIAGRGQGTPVGAEGPGSKLPPRGVGQRPHPPGAEVEQANTSARRRRTRACARRG